MVDGRIIVCDLDGVINNLLYVVQKRVGSEMPNAYDITAATNLSESEKAQWLRLLGTDELWWELSVMDGADELQKLTTPDYAFYVHSLSWTEKTAAIKRVWLKKSLPWLSEERTSLPIGRDKDAFNDGDVYAAIEDCADNLYKYRDSVLKVLIDMSYNRPAREGVVRVKDLHEAVRVIEAAVARDSATAGRGETIIIV